VGWLIGATDGAAMGQMLGGQIGRRSIELAQSGCIWPFTHWHIRSSRKASTNAHKTPVLPRREAQAAPASGQVSPGLLDVVLYYRYDRTS